MPKKKAIVTILLIIGASVTGFLAWYFLTKQYLPACSTDTPFTANPVNMTRLHNIVPLGNLNPPPHTFPTDHIYFHCDNALFPDGFEIYAPGDITITRVIKVTYDPPQAESAEDFTIEFQVCRELSGTLGHVNNLSQSLLSSIGEFGAPGDEVNSYVIAGRTYTQYRKYVNIPLAAGTQLGFAGWHGYGYDFWIKDTRKTLTWVNKDWTSQFLYTACPLSYFTTAIKTALETFLGSYTGSLVDPQNYCGKIDFDIAGTAQGIWTRSDYTAGSTGAEEIGLALVYSNFNSSIAAISIGTAGSDSSTYSWDESVCTFVPSSSGHGNRSFDAITPDGNTYFFFCEEFESGGSYTKTILLKMTDSSHIRMQFIDNGITPLPSDPRSLWSDSAAITYFR